MAIKTFGRISITNITQVGQLRLQPMTNSPTQILFNPDNNACVPDWSVDQMEITPRVFFNTDELTTEFSVEYYKRDGMATESQITATTGNEYISGKKLIVKNSSVLKNAVNGTITYRIKVGYTEPKSNTFLSAEGTMSFSLIKNAATLKYVSISGDSAFLYNAAQEIQGSSEIKLTARVTGVPVKNWQYQKADGTWANYPTTNNPDLTKEELIVRANDPTFSNDKLVVRVNTTDDAVFDLHTISKIRDGAAGTDNLSIALSNSSHTLPATHDGTPTTYNGASTEVHVYRGGVDETNLWDIDYEVSDPANITVAHDQNTGVYSISRIAKTIDVATVTFKATKAGDSSDTKPLIAKFTVTKIKAGTDGADAVTYRIVASTLVVNKSEAGVLTPDKIVFRAKKKVGAEAEANYSGRFYIYESDKYNPGDNDWVKKSNSTTDEVSRQYIPTDSAVMIKCVLLPSGSTDVSKELDNQMIVITNDGAKGADGETGEGGLSVTLGNEADIISCTNGGLVSGAQTISIPYTVYKGITQVAGSAEISGTLPSGMTVTSITNASASAPGVITLAVANNATLGGSTVLHGEINIIISMGDVSTTKKFSWSKNNKAKDGVNAVLVQLFAPQGDIIVKNLVGTPNNVVIQTNVVDGTTVVTSGVTYKWYKENNGTYQQIAGQTGSSLTVTPDMVDTFGFFQCKVTYKSKEYDGYYMVTDRSDPCEVTLISSLGTQFVNNDKPGVIYAVVTQNGADVDPLKTAIFSETAPANPSNGQFYYQINKSARTVTLMKYSGSSWAAAAASDLPKLTYNWYRIDPTSNAVDTSSVWKTGKVVYFDNVDTAPSLHLVCEVTD